MAMEYAPRATDRGRTGVTLRSDGSHARAPGVWAMGSRRRNKRSTAGSERYSGGMRLLVREGDAYAGGSIGPLELMPARIETPAAVGGLRK